MTTMSLPGAPARPESEASLRRMAWRRMAWITWRQHGFALAGVAAFLGALAGWLWTAGIALHHAYAAATPCHPAGALARADVVTQFNDLNPAPLGGYPPQPRPAPIGAVGR